jgi:hypothetical protein
VTTLLTLSHACARTHTKDTLVWAVPSRPPSRSVPRWYRTRGSTGSALLPVETAHGRGQFQQRSYRYLAGTGDLETGNTVLPVNREIPDTQSGIYSAPTNVPQETTTSRVAVSRELPNELLGNSAPPPTIPPTTPIWGHRLANLAVGNRHPAAFLAAPSPFNSDFGDVHAS